MARVNKGRFRRSFLSLFMALAFVAPGPASFAHNYHVSIASVDYNARSKSFEVIHEFFAHDMIAVLSVYAGERLSLDDPDIEVRIRDYLARAFSLSVAGKPLDLEWVGAEIAGDQITTYQEARLSEIPGAVAVHNQLLMEQFPSQLNTVNIKIGDMVRTARFTADEQDATLDLRP